MRVTLRDDDDGRLVLEEDRGRLYFHVKFKQWSIAKFREYRRYFEWVLAVIAESNAQVREVYAYPYEHDEKAQHMIQLFGFRPVGASEGFLLMRRKIGDDHA